MRKFLSLVLALTMAMSLVVVNTSAKEFTDNDELNYKEAVDVISEIGVVDGYADGSFNPQGGLTRGAAAKIICNLILGPTTAAELHADTRPFSDVAINSEFAGYIAYCAQQGIISGYADGEFKAANPLTGYAFMKMLLGALGYSSETESYVGENWSINVAKQAIGIGLNQGLVDEFNGVDYVTREEAALYAFNTLKATLVDYDNTITADVNGASVTISNNTAKPVTWSEGRNNDGNIKDDGFVQFAEEFFPDLERLDDDTKFMEPANTWLYDRVEIGTYERTDLLVESYTTGVSGREIYDLLKSGVIADNDLAVYVDGVDKYGTDPDEEFNEDDLVRSNTSDLPNTGNGVLTKVYLDNDKEIITVVSINTWLAQATTDYSEANEYATLRVYTGVTNGTPKTVTTANYNVDVEEVANVVDVTTDTFYQVNISWKDNNMGEVVVINDVETLEDSTITEYSSDNGNAGDAKVTKLTTGGEEYNANEKAFYDDEILYQYDMDLLTDATYNVYLDQYGYFLGVDLFEGTQNYVFITGFDRNTSNLSVKTATAGAIFLDGTMEPIEVNINATDDNIEDAIVKGDDNADLFIPWSTQGYNVVGSDWDDQGKYGVGGIYNLNQWYTYTVNESGVYTLKPCVRMTWTQYDPDNAATMPSGWSAGDDVIIRTDNLSLADRHPVTNNVPNLSGRVYGEDATVFLTVDLDIVDTTNGIQKAITDVNGVYTGVQDVDLLIDIEDQQAIDEGQVYTVFDSDGYVIGAVVIGEAQGATGNYAYVLSQAKSEGRVDGEYYYWTFDAIVEGEKQTLTARSSYGDTIGKLTKGDVVELRFDGDYVVNVKTVPMADRYTVMTDQIDGEDVYFMDNLTASANVVSLQRNTLYITANRNDVGLGIARDAKAVVIQDENRDKDVVTNFGDVESAVNYLVDPDDTTSVKEYSGKIVAILNSSGAAEWIVFDSDTPLTTGGSGTTHTEDYITYNYYVTGTGYGRMDFTVTRPSFIGLNTDLEYEFDVYANGRFFDRVEGEVGGTYDDVASGDTSVTDTWTTPFWGGALEAGTVLTVENFRFTNLDDQYYYVKYVDQRGNVLSNTTWDADENKAATVFTSQTNAVMATGATVVSFTVDTAAYPSGNYSWSIAGVHSTSALAPASLTASGVAAGTSTGTVNSVTVDANRMDYVVVTLNMGTLTGTYTVTGRTGSDDGSSYSLAQWVPGYAGYGASKLMDINVVADGAPKDSSNSETVAAGANVDVYLDFGAGNYIPNTVGYGLRITLSTGDTVLFKNDGSQVDAKVDLDHVSANTTITVTSVEAVAAPTVSWSWEDMDRSNNLSDGDTVTLSFDGPVTVVNVPATSGAAGATVTASVANGATNVRNIVYTVVGTPTTDLTITLAAGDIVDRDDLQVVPVTLTVEKATGAISR